MNFKKIIFDTFKKNEANRKLLPVFFKCLNTHFSKLPLEVLLIIYEYKLFFDDIHVFVIKQMSGSMLPSTPRCWSGRTTGSWIITKEKDYVWWYDKLFKANVKLINTFFKNSVRLSPTRAASS